MPAKISNRRKDWIMLRRLLPLITIVALALPTITMADAYPKVENYDLDITFVPHEAAMSGTASVTFVPETRLEDTVVFYLHGELRIDSIKHAGGKLEYDWDLVIYPYDYSGVAIEVSVPMSSFDQSSPLQIFYKGHFNPSKARSPSNYMRIDTDGVYLRAYAYSIWFPMFLESRQDTYKVDFKEVTIRCPSEFTSVFIGNRLGDEIIDNQKVSRWSATDVDLFYPQCTVHRFKQFSDGPYHVYYRDDAESESAATRILEFSRWFTVRSGQRFIETSLSSQFHIVQMPRYGDISSGNVTGISSALWKQFTDNSYSGATLAHELVHSFVQIPIERDDPLYAMVIEGFPSCFDIWVLQERLGRDWYMETLQRSEQSYLKKRQTGSDRRGKLPLEKPLDQITADEIGIYKDRFIIGNRTTLFINYLQTKMGETKYATFERELFDNQSISNESFRELVLYHLPGFDDDLHTWLSTNEYPDRFLLDNLN